MLTVQTAEAMHRALTITAVLQILLYGLSLYAPALLAAG